MFEDWSRQHTLMTVFFVILLAGAYMYFFTDIIVDNSEDEPEQEIIDDPNDIEPDDSIDIPEQPVILDDDMIEREVDDFKSMAESMNLVETTVEQTDEIVGEEDNPGAYHIKTHSSDMNDIDMYLEDISYSSSSKVSEIVIQRDGDSIALSVNVLIQ